MSEEVEIETKELQNTIEELQEERKEREQEERRNAWTRYIALTTAILAVFAAVAALQSGSLINESMMDQLRASDKWNEYQAARQKEHLYTIQAHQLLDRGVRFSPSAKAKGRNAPDAGPSGSARPKPSHPDAGAAGSLAPEQKAERNEWKAAPLAVRLRQYVAQAEKEREKESDLQREARDLERESDHKAHRHHQFASSVALIQVAISLSAVAALTRMKSVWWLSLAVGVAGIIFFILGSVGVR
jgi:hypothetical protein